MNLHIGCGKNYFGKKNYLGNWVNIDINLKVVADKYLDVRKGLPFDIQTVNFIFTEHCIEHLTLQEGINFLKECYRVLKPQGVLRISTPDLQKIVDHYFNGVLIQIPEWKPETLCRMVNEALHKWGHKFCYDIDELEMILSNIGFSQYYKESFGLSDYKELCSVETRTSSGKYTLIVEAVK